MRKLTDAAINWDVIPQTPGEIEGVLLRTDATLQKLYETRIMVQESHGDKPDAEKLMAILEEQIVYYERDREALHRITAVTELLDDVAELPRIELPPIPKKKKARKARKPKGTDATS